MIELDSMWAYTLIDETGNEAIILDPMTPLGPVPLMGGSDFDPVKLEQFATRIAAATNRPITLVRFTHREVLKIISPPHKDGLS